MFPVVLSELKLRKFSSPWNLLKSVYPMLWNTRSHTLNIVAVIPRPVRVWVFLKKGTSKMRKELLVRALS